MSEWQTRTVEELCERITSGGTPRRSEPRYYHDGAIPWIKTGELHDAYVTQYEECITQEGLENSSAKLLPQDTILMAMYGATVGALGMLAEPATCNQASCALIANLQECHPRWLFYRLLDDRDRIVSYATGAAQQNLSGTLIRDLKYRVPSLEEQRAIAEVLGALDDKIEANRKLAATADALARVRFRAMHDAGSRMIALSDVARFVNGRAFTKDATGTGRVVVRIAELNSGISASTVRNDLDVADEHVARPGDLLFAWSGSLTLARWYRPEAIVNQHIFKVIPRDGYPMWLVNQLILEKLHEFQAVAADKATTMGHIQRRHLDDPVRLPDRAAIDASHASMDALWNRALLAERENETLATLRDTLLPKLMSGQLRVEAAEEMVVL